MGTTGVAQLSSGHPRVERDNRLASRTPPSAASCRSRPSLVHEPERSQHIHRSAKMEPLQDRESERAHLLRRQRSGLDQSHLDMLHRLAHVLALQASKDRRDMLLFAQARLLSIQRLLSHTSNHDLGSYRLWHGLQAAAKSSPDHVYHHAHEHLVQMGDQSLFANHLLSNLAGQVLDHEHDLRVLDGRLARRDRTILGP